MFLKIRNRVFIIYKGIPSFQQKQKKVLVLHINENEKQGKDGLILSCSILMIPLYLKIIHNRLNGWTDVHVHTFNYI
jgi:hypothetical protein